MKPTQLNNKTMNKHLKTLAVVAAIMLIATNPAYADLAGGLGKIESNMNTFLTSLKTLVAIGAVIYLIWKGLETWRGRSDWGEFGISVGYVALVGAATVIATWAMSAFA